MLKCIDTLTLFSPLHPFILFLNSMTYPWILYFAFVLGLNPYAQLLPRYIFYLFVAVNILYVIISSLYIIYNCIVMKLSFILILSVAYRMCLSCFFISSGALDYDSTVRFYDEIFSEIKSSTTIKDINLFSSVTVCVSCVILLESIHVYHKNILENCAMFFSACLHIFVPQITMAQYSLCYVVVHSVFSCLKRDIQETSPHTATYTVRRLRARQVDISDIVRNVNQVFSLKVLLYFVVIQIMLIQKVDLILSRIVKRNYDIVLVATSITLLFHLLVLWLYCYTFWRAQKKVSYYILRLSQNE